MPEKLRQDLRFAFRTLSASPGFSALAILTLALGIGASTALFSVVNGVLLNPLAHPHSDQLVALYQSTSDFPKGTTSYLNFLDWEHDTRTFSSMAIYRNQDYNFIAADGAERVSGYMVSHAFFTTLDANPILGRTFRTDDDQPGAAPVVILGGGFWARQFASDPSIIGKSIVLGGASYTVIGVIPDSFTFYGQHRDVYTLIGQWKEPLLRDRRLIFSSSVIGRLKPGILLTQAQADMQRVARNLAANFADADKGVNIALVSMKEDTVGGVRPILLVLLGAVGFLLLIACTNVANLLLARSLRRSREFAIRTALGASHLRVIRQLLTESILLAGLGGAFGLALAIAATKTSARLLPATLPRSNEVSPDLHVLLFALSTSLLAGILFGLVPAIRSSRVSLQEVLKETGRGLTGARHRLQGIFVATEIAVTLILLVGAGLMTRSIAALWRVDPGFNPDHAITFSVSIPPTGKTTGATARSRLRELERRMAAIPGVRAVSITLGSRPMIHNSTEAFWIDGHPKPPTFNDMNEALFYLVESGFEQAMGIKLQRGRFITPADDEHSRPVIVIDDVFARTYFPHEDPIGQRLHLAGFNVEAEIIGVAGHVKQWGLDSDSKAEIQAQFYYPFLRLPDTLMPTDGLLTAVVLRTQADPALIMRPIRQALREMDIRSVVYNVDTMNKVVADSFAARRLSMILLSAFAALALLLACIGIYGVISYLVGQRTQEIGVRMALGAQSADVLRLILGQGTGMALSGIAVGVIGALALTRLLSHQLFGVSAHDPLTFIAVALLLVLIAVAACYIPARRALKVDPIIALRYQ